MVIRETPRLLPAVKFEPFAPIKLLASPDTAILLTPLSHRLEVAQFLDQLIHRFCLLGRSIFFHIRLTYG